MKKYIFPLLTILSLIAIQCKKSSTDAGDQLPPITTTGANTFGCLVNGNVWLPYGVSYSVPTLNVNVVIPTGNSGKSEIQIFANKAEQNENSGIYITIRGISDTGTYQIENYLNTGLVYFNGNTSYEPFDTFGIVHISRCDTIQKIISGTFSFIGYTNTNHSIGETVSITEGRFDVHWPLLKTD